MNRPRSTPEVVIYATNLVRQNLYFAAFCVLRTLSDDPVWNLPNTKYLLCLCAIGMMDVEVLREHKNDCSDAHLRQLCDALCDDGHDSVVKELRSVSLFARPLVVTPTAPVGIVIPAGGSELLTQLVVNLRSLRNTGCTLPVVVAHANELTDDQIEYLRKDYGTDFLNVSAVMPPGEWKGFQIKLASLVSTTFETCILSDADIIWTNNPQNLVDRMKREDAEVLLFKDIWHFRTKPHNKTMSTAWVYAKHGIATDTHETESGVVVMNALNRRMKAALRYVTINYEYFFKLMFGDKDLYKLVAHAADARVTMMPVPRLLCYCKVGSQTMVGHSMLQTTPDGSPSHIHTTLLPMKRDAKQPPMPSHSCSAETVEFITTSIDGKSSQTVGCKEHEAQKLEVDSNVCHVLASASAFASQLSAPW